MDDITEFVTARLDEDEANARAALALWADTHFTINPGSLVILDYHRRHQPKRALRELVSRRAILVRHQPVAVGRWQVCGNCRTADPAYPDDLATVLHPCPDLRELASTWSDHPDHRKEWRP